ncbi:MAG: ABC transporter ATP-binding protein [Nitrospiraceae bacterium]|nr:ABC transporter ATP-binding protein [Nitrospiraceae bacterium]
MSPESSPLLETRGLVREFDLPGGGLFGRRKTLTAVSDVSFAIGKGEILGLVGESGSGKTTIGRMVMRLLDPTRGQVIFDGLDLTRLSGRSLRRQRRRFQMVFQDPYASLNPRMRAGEIVGEPLVIHGLAPSARELREKVSRLLERVGLSSHDLERYPREFSGGGRQRIGIARAIACQPDLLVADEPIASLDLSIGAQIINLFSSLNKTERMSLLFISHDLSVVRYLSDRVVVLYRGRMVESGPTRTVLDTPVHPYTRLLAGTSSGTPSETQNGGDEPSGSLCPFLTRCPEALPVCRESMPPSLENSECGRQVLCHLVAGHSPWKSSASPSSSQGSP